jgi:superfamily II DNA or RNA helicase
MTDPGKPGDGLTGACADSLVGDEQASGSKPFPLIQAPRLRPYQTDVIDQLNAEVAAGRRRILLVAPTGSGKTIIAAAIIADALRNDAVADQERSQ